MLAYEKVANPRLEYGFTCNHLHNNQSAHGSHPFGQPGMISSAPESE
jgi:hypothetical protein